MFPWGESSPVGPQGDLRSPPLAIMGHGSVHSGTFSRRMTSPHQTPQVPDSRTAQNLAPSWHGKMLLQRAERCFPASQSQMVPQWGPVPHLCHVQALQTLQSTFNGLAWDPASQWLPPKTSHSLLQVSGRSLRFFSWDACPTPGPLHRVAYPSESRFSGATGETEAG